jgi:hypothetical protein
MALHKTDAREKLFDLSAKSFSDVVTTLRPSKEVELSAGLARLHNLHRIDWGKIKLHPIEAINPPQLVLASEFILKGHMALNEYPLFALLDTCDEKRWGGYRADILFLDEGQDNLLLVENKIGDRLTVDYVRAVLEWLDSQSKFQTPCFVLLTGREFIKENWYRNELIEGSAKRNSAGRKADLYIMYWEEVFAACAAP